MLGWPRIPSNRWAMNCAPHIPTGHAGLQPELLRYHCCNRKRKWKPLTDETYATVDDATAFSVSGGQDLESRRRVGVSYSDHYEKKEFSAVDGSPADH